MPDSMFIFLTRESKNYTSKNFYQGSSVLGDGEVPVYVEDRTLSVVVPAYNEGKRILPILTDIQNNMPEVQEIIVVCDGKDNTAEVSRSAGSKVRVLEFKERLGHGGAVFEGFKASSSDYVCFIDADGAAPWYEVRRLFRMVSKETPAVIGSRWSEGARILKKESLRNIVGGRVYHYLALMVLGVREKDSFCGLKIFTKDLALELTKRVTVIDRAFNIALMYHLKLMGIKVREVGIEWSHNEDTNLPVSLKVIAMMLLTLFGLRLRHKIDNRSLHKKLSSVRKEVKFY